MDVAPTHMSMAINMWVTFEQGSKSGQGTYFYLSARQV